MIVDCPIAICSIFLSQHDGDDPLGDGRISWIGRVHRHIGVVVDAMERRGAESCPSERPSTWSEELRQWQIKLTIEVYVASRSN
jgi:hypothetical protein